MKNIYITAVIVFASTFGFAQEEFDLFGEWFLHYRTVDGVDTYPPLASTENYDIILNFRLLPPDAGNPFIIESYGPTTTFYEGRFDMDNGLMEIFYVNETALNCEHPPVICSYFEDYNNEILFDPNTIVETGEHNVTVELEGVDDDALLIIINESNGERAFYYRQALSIQDNEFLSSNITIDSNPVADQLSLSINYSQMTGYEIYSISGKLVSNATMSTNLIDVGQLQSGLYFLLVYNDQNKAKTLKFIKK